MKFNDPSESQMAVNREIPEIVIKNEPTERSSEEYFAMDAAPVRYEVGEQPSLHSGYDSRDWNSSINPQELPNNSNDSWIEYKPLVDELKYGGANMEEAESHNEGAAANNQKTAIDTKQNLLAESQYRHHRARGKCKKSLKSTEAVIRHTGNHNAKQDREATFECYLCKKLLSSKHYVKQHVVLVHTGLKRFQCPYETCRKRFAWKSSHKTHVNVVHRGEKRFQCQCLKRFATQSYLKKHIKSIHSGAFQCPFQTCLLRFSGRKRLKEHIKTVHNGVKPFPCTYQTCKKTFAQELHVRRHIKRYHLKRRLANEQEPDFVSHAVVH